jgi:REP element-mobilizing transposase RayT
MGRRFFSVKATYRAFLEALRNVRQRYPFSLYGYALMPNHFHLLLEVHRFPTARILQSLLTGYVRRFNKIHHRRGHLFEGRYKTIVCDRDSYLLELVRYIHLNPVRAKIVKRPGEWQWSGHGEYLGNEKRGLIDSGPVMGQLRTVGGYEVFIRDGAKVNYRAEWHPGDGAPFLGPERFAKKIAKESVAPPNSRRVNVEGFTEERSGKVGTLGGNITSQGPIGECGKRPRSIHA